jgi:membrane protease YdiL (CAAX protease family)
MSFFMAAMWAVSARLSFDLITSVLSAAHASGRLDLVSQVLCQGIAFVGTLYLMVIVHDRDRPLSEALGLRRTHVGLCIVAAAIGLALHGPMLLVANAIAGHFPPSEDEVATMQFLFDAPALHQRVALVGAAGIMGPFVEELFFRGGILRNLRRAHTAGLTLLGTSLLFAAAHLDPRNFLPVFLGGLAMGYVRILSGSLWPSILLHAAFNSTSVLVALEVGPDADALTRPQSFAAAVVTLGLVALYGMLALRSELCSEARAQDVT